MKAKKGMGFKAAQKSIAKKQGVSMKSAGAILAAGGAGTSGSSGVSGAAGTSGTSGGGASFSGTTNKVVKPLATGNPATCIL